MNKYNIKEFKKLIKKYKSLTKEKLEKTIKSIPFDDEAYTYSYVGAEVMSKLTGFGHTEDCSLCIEANKLCKDGFYCDCCLYSIFYMWGGISLRKQHIQKHFQRCFFWRTF